MTSTFGQLYRFALVGVANTGVFLGIYLLLRTLFTPTAANVVATVITTVVATSANGRFTFGAESTGARQHLQGLALAALGLAITTAAVNVVATDDQVLELVVLTAAGCLAGGLRFVLLRNWVFASTAR